MSHTAKEWKRLLPIITAFAEGETIQVQKYDYSRWEDSTPDDEIAFCFTAEHYRIKPKIKKVRVWCTVKSPTYVFMATDLKYIPWRAFPNLGSTESDWQYKDVEFTLAQNEQNNPPS